jgi:hypothetical protein
MILNLVTKGHYLRSEQQFITNYSQTMKTSLKVLLLLGLAVASSQAAGPVTKKLGEAKRKTLA